MKKKKYDRDIIMAVIKKPGEIAEMKKIPNTLEAFQETVGGYIETVTLASYCIIICNEEGRLLGLPFNCKICGMSFYGPIALVGSTIDDFCSIPGTIDDIKRYIPSLNEI